ncbi:MAG: guanosine polyphosphate pyrophosphohydrolase [Lachnospiraceae bacterium]
MIKLNDYLYSGDTVLRILQKYSAALEESASKSHNEVDTVHAAMLGQVMDLLLHNDFLTAQSQKIREFYVYMAKEYPYLAFTLKGRIKSLIRTEEKFNGYVVQYIYEYYRQNGTYPAVSELTDRLNSLRDLIAYRIVISVPGCHLRDETDREEVEKKYLYQLANALPDFLRERGFIPQEDGIKISDSNMLDEAVKPYYRDYVCQPSEYGYQSLHITFYDESAKCYIELQLRTKRMDDVAEIGLANHSNYEKRQDCERARRNLIPQGECVYFDEAYERGILLQELDLSKLNVNMFAAVNNSLMNDCCGLFRGRLILPYEHLSRFQNEYLD